MCCDMVRAQGHILTSCNNCQCQSCGNDQGERCLAETGNCKEAQQQGRCPVKECPMYKPKEEPHEQSD